MRLIDVDKLKFPNIAIFDMKLHGVTVPMVRLIDLQMLMPTVDAAPVKHGQWIHCKGESSIWYCSVCGEKIIYNPTRKTYKPSKKPVSEINKYCRNCGVKMDLEEQNE